MRAVFLHHFFSNRAGVADSELLPLLAAALDREYPREWYYALMDYGVMLKHVHKNPSRASAHYTKQSKFEGSLREIRGKIVKILSVEKTLFTAFALTRRVAEPSVKISVALHSLVRDGLVKKDGRKFSIA